MAEERFTVSGIHCGGCANTIESGLRRMDGIRRVSADAETKVVTLRFDEHRLDADAVAAHLERLGFPAARQGGGS